MVCEVYRSTDISDSRLVMLDKYNYLHLRVKGCGGGFAGPVWWQCSPELNPPPPASSSCLLAACAPVSRPI